MVAVGWGVSCGALRGWARGRVPRVAAFPKNTDNAAPPVAASPRPPGELRPLRRALKKGTYRYPHASVRTGSQHRLQHDFTVCP